MEHTLDVDFVVDDFYSGYPAFSIPSCSARSDLVDFLYDDTKGDIIESER